MKKSLKPLTLPLIALVAINLLPSITLRPPWFLLAAVVFLLYRTWLEITQRRMPPRWAQWVVQAAVGMGVWQHYHSLFGDEAAGTWLSLLCVLKLFELRSKRDFFINALLCFLVLMSALLLDQSLILSVFLLIDSLLILGYLYALEEERWNWRELRRLALRPMGLFLRVIPLLALIFVLFPRFSTGFGTGANQGAKMGITDQLRPGSISQLNSSDELVFRATFLNGDVPLVQNMYWRGAVLSHSAGLEWDGADREEFLRPPVANERQNEIEIYLEPGFEKFLFSLGNTAAIYLPNDIYRNRVTFRSGDIFALTQPLQTRERYFLEAGPPRVEAEKNLERYLKVAVKPSEKVQELLRPLQNLSNGQKVQRLLEHFQTGGFVYSLQPPTAASMDDFLFKTKEGFCEHFAASMGTLLRFLHVPSRVVVGFQGGSRSFLDNYISVRAHDAHSWLEFYDNESKRWRRVDPTASIALSRLMGTAEMARQWMPEWVPDGWATTYLKGRALVDEIEANWIGFLIRFDLAKQRDLLAKLGMEAVLFRALPVFLILAVVLVLAILYFIEAQGREQLSTEELLYRKFIRALRSFKVEKHPHEGPLTLMARIELANSKLAEKAEPILRALVEARFGSKPLTGADASKISRQIRSLTKL